MRKIGFLMLLALILAVFGWFIWRFRMQKTAQRSSTAPSELQKIHIVASFYPLGYFTQRIAGDLADVRVLVAPGIEPHDFEPTPQDIAYLTDATVFVYNGAGFEPWATKIVEMLPAEKMVNTTADVALRPNDPHVWLDPVLAQQQVAAIANRLAQNDATHADIYQQNAAKLTQELQQLDSEFRSALSTCAQHTIVTSHNAFGYLAARYNLEVVAITGLSPEEEPSAKKLAELSDFVREKRISTIFFESLVSPKLAQTLAQESGAKTAVFNPLEGLTPEEIQQGDNYFTIQRNNLASLRAALECK